MAKVEIKQFFKAPPAQVFRAVGTHAALGVMAKPMTVKRIRDSADPQHVDGLGSIRLITLLPFLPKQLGIQEQITAFQPDELIEYKIVNSPLIKHHHGKLVFTPKNGGTELIYTIELNGPLSALDQVLLQGLKFNFGRGLAKLAKQIG